jgi:hypothetical protein
MEEYSDIGVLQLVLAIFRYTAQDLRYGNESIKKEALDFLESEWFDELCEYFNYSPCEVKHLILYSPISWRNKYE